MSEPKKMSTPQLRRALAAEPRPCASAPELFFEPDRDDERFRGLPVASTDAVRKLREQAAAVLCDSCPVRALCFEYALRIRPEYGIWAGHTAQQLADFADESREVA